MKAKDRLREATKQLDIVADDAEITSGQREAAEHMAALVEDGQLRVEGGEDSE